MKRPEAFLTLIAELDADLAEFRKVAGRNRRAWERILAGAEDPIDWGALGFTLHGLYGVMESYFLRISKFFENGLPREAWHKALVDRMRLDIPGVRPALFRNERELKLALELLKFRHRLRHPYGEDLDPYRTREIQGMAEAFIAAFPGMHGEFIAKLRAIAEALA